MSNEKRVVISKISLPTILYKQYTQLICENEFIILPICRSFKSTEKINTKIEQTIFIFQNVSYCLSEISKYNCAKPKNNIGERIDDLSVLYPFGDR